MNKQENEPFPLKWPAHLRLAQSEQHAYSPHKRHVDRQIIVTGRSKDIDRVVHLAAEEMNSPRSASRIVENPLNVLRIDDLFPANAAWWDQRLSPFAGLEIRQYDLEGDESESAVWRAVRTIYQQAEKECLIVLADPNLIAGNPSGGASGGANGNPVGNTGEIDGRYRDPDEVYRDHWAFRARDLTKPFRGWGINLEKAKGARQVAESGKGVRVFILDTYDPSLGVPPENQPGLTGGEMAVIDRGYPHYPIHFNLRVSRLPASVCLTEDPKQVHTVHEHGLYVTGLLNRVAPDANLHLVQVLDDFGRGEAFTLAHRLAMIASYAMRTPASAGLPLGDVVVNMSLETTVSEDLILSLGVREAINKLWDKVKQQGDAEDALYGLLKEIVERFYYIPSVRLPIQILNRLGAVLVSAAGNRSSDYYGHLPMSVPARYPEVIGVAANNYKGDLSSFSNQSYVLAPGGGPEDDEDQIKEVSDLSKGNGEDISIYAMVSIVPYDQEPEGLAYWWGTSFSAPLVSGLAALLLDKSLQDGKKGLNPAQVKELIVASARDGIIDVQAALNQIA